MTTTVVTSAIDELKQQVEELTDSSQYTEAADLVAKSFQIKMEVISSRFGSMPWDKDGQQRRIFKICLAKGKASYTFDFGQSVVNSFQKSKISELDTDKEVSFKIGLEGGEKQLHLVVNTTTQMLRKYLANKEYHLFNIIDRDYLTKEIEKVNDRLRKEDTSKPKFARRTLFTFSNVHSHLYMLIDNQISKLQKTFIDEVSPDIIEPTMYDILTCLTKYNPGSFEDFCGDFGYDEDSRAAERTYKAVVKEYKALAKMFTEEELEVLQLIN